RAYDDAASGRPGTPVTLDPTANDLTAGTWDTGSLRLLDPVSGAAVVTVTVAGVGTWTARSDGTVLFDPVDGYAGTASVGYTVEDSTGAAVEARLTVTYPMVATEPSQSPAATPTDGPTPSVSPTPVPVAPTDKPLATTGAEVLPWLLATAVLLAAGGVLVTLRVRRREE
ncbi:MAG TPA: cadherin-like domain-containing protein, partial [Cellulomonas sp.]|nr:cadherin-like domain-containing protein [Cellulomonas sp.]